MPQLDLLILSQNVSITINSFIVYAFPVIWMCIRHIIESIYNKNLSCNINYEKFFFNVI
jgi:hypothetical protein